MRVNLPVTTVEHEMRADQIIVSSTDLKGRITKTNRAFVEISGYSEQELIGAPHNLIRHPDMPAAAFADLWATIQAGKPWTGIVKNRCKNGDFYWVEANVSAIRKDGVTIGYISVRRKPTREQISAAEALYERMRAGKPALPLAARILSRVANVRVTRALPGGLAVISLIFLLAIAQSLWTLRESMGQMTRLTERTLVLEQAYNEMFTQGLQMVAAMRFILLNPVDTKVRKTLAKAQESFDGEIARIRDLSADNVAALEVLDRIDAGRQAHVAVHRRILERIDAVDLAGARAIYDAEEARTWRPYKKLMLGAVKDIKLDAANERDRFMASIQQAERRVYGFTLAAVIAAPLLGVWLVRKIAGPLAGLLGHLGAIADADYSKRIEVSGHDEMGQMMLAVKAVQARLDFEMQEVRRLAEEGTRIRFALDNVTVPVSVSDDQNALIYLNHAGRRLWQGMSRHLLERHPGFDVDRLYGHSLAGYLESEADRAKVGEASESTVTLDTELGDRCLHLTASPVKDGQGHYLGRVIQWVDRSDEHRAQREIADLIQAAGSGDFSKRIDPIGKEGFFLELTEELNRLMGTVARGLAEVAQVLDAIAQGDLSRSMDGDYQGTFAQVKDDTNATVAQLSEVVRRILEASDAIGTAAAEIASGNADLSGRTEEQAASLEQTASSMEELSSTVKQNAQNAARANQLAQDANAVAQRGGDIVKGLVRNMDDIQASSKQIADIISVIDSIAFQTNILALNAAVEAARAGEQGRGFAVVAAEVRGLAQRSAQAAKEIKTLITDSVDKIDGGAKLASDAGGTMQEIVGSFHQVAGLVDEIAGASRQQSSGIEQVTAAISNMDEVTQQNAALVEEAAAAAESLEEQARVLTRAVSAFRIGASSGQPQPLEMAPRDAGTPLASTASGAQAH